MRDTIDMAREAGIELDLIDEDEGQIWYITTEGMKSFEALVRADERSVEREACAKVCEELGSATNGIYERNHECAAAIRARGRQ